MLVRFGLQVCKSTPQAKSNIEIGGKKNVIFRKKFRGITILTKMIHGVKCKHKLSRFSQDVKKIIINYHYWKKLEENNPVF